MKKKLLLLTPLILLTIITGSTQVVINEYSAANYTDVADNYGEYEDWIELYNAGVASVDLSGYYLSDREDEPTKYSIPAGVTISAGVSCVFGVLPEIFLPEQIITPISN